MTSPEFDIDNAPDTVIGGQALDALEYFPDGMFQAIFISQFDFIATDLKEIMVAFWGEEGLRTCRGCEAIVVQPGEATLPASA